MPGPSWFAQTRAPKGAYDPQNPPTQPPGGDSWPSDYEAQRALAVASRNPTSVGGILGGMFSPLAALLSLLHQNDGGSYAPGEAGPGAPGLGMRFTPPAPPVPSRPMVYAPQGDFTSALDAALGSLPPGTPPSMAVLPPSLGESRRDNWGATRAQDAANVPPVTPPVPSTPPPLPPAPGAPGFTGPVDTKYQGAPGTIPTKDYYYNFNDPRGTFAVDQGMREMGIMPNSSNPFVTFLQQKAQDAFPNVLVRAVTSGGGLTPDAIQQYVREVLTGTAPPTGPADFQSAAQAARDARTLMAGVTDQAQVQNMMKDPLLKAKLLLAMHMADPRNTAAMYANNAGMAPGFSRLLQRGVGDLYNGAYMANAPGFATNNIDFGDWLAGLGPHPLPPRDWNQAYNAPMPAALAALQGLGGR